MIRRQRTKKNIQNKTIKTRKIMAKVELPRFMDVWAIIYTAHENNPTERIRLSCIIARKGVGR